MGAKEVAAGAEWLDENFPGWEREIDLGTLDLGDCEACICGQSLRKHVMGATLLDNGYSYAVYGMGDGLQWAKDHGFHIDSEHETSDLWLDLETLWRDLIKERFSTGNLSDADEE